MKKFKELAKQISILQEGEETTGGASRSAFSDDGVHRIEEPEQLSRVNAFLNAFNKKDFIEPRAAIAQIRHKFNIIGLDFDWNGKSEVSNSMKLKLTKFGGTFGKAMQTPHSEFETTDGFEKGKSYTLNINLKQQDGGLYKLDAKVVAGG